MKREADGERGRSDAVRKRRTGDRSESRFRRPPLFVYARTRTRTRGAPNRRTDAEGSTPGRETINPSSSRRPAFCVLPPFLRVLRPCLAQRWLQTARSNRRRMVLPNRFRSLRNWLDAPRSVVASSHLRKLTSDTVPSCRSLSGFSTEFEKSRETIGFSNKM